MSSSSKELLHLEHTNLSTASPLESTLLVCKKVSQSKKPPTKGKPMTIPVPQSQVLGKVKDFLGVISEANKRLEQEAKDNSQIYDIEALTGTESEVIEMDLMLGITDLQTPEAVAAAESAIRNSQSLLSSDSDSSEMESEGTSNDDDNDETDNDNDDDDKTCLPLKHKTSKFSKDDSNQAVGRKGPKKRPKIVEL